MDYNTYLKRVRAIRQEYANRIVEVDREFALSNQKYHIGDIVTDGYRIVKIGAVSVGVPIFARCPQCCYHGVELTKKLIPAKIQRGYDMWEGAIKKQL